MKWTLWRTDWNDPAGLLRTVGHYDTENAALARMRGLQPNFDSFYSIGYATPEEVRTENRRRIDAVAQTN